MMEGAVFWEGEGQKDRGQKIRNRLFTDRLTATNPDTQPTEPPS